MSVVERPDGFVVAVPGRVDKVVEPFGVFEKPPPAAPVKSLIVLNTELQQIDVRRLWASAELQVCADGGANRLYEFFQDEEERARYVPRFITGDCDSLRDEVRDYYAEKGSVVIPQTSQYSTDFMKAMKVILLHGTEACSSLQAPIEPCDGLSTLMDKHVGRKSVGGQKHAQVIVNVAGGIGGRFDQTFHSINQLYTVRREYPWVDLYFFTGYDVIFLLPKGVTYVKYSSREIFYRPNKVPSCGLLPFGRKTLLRTLGLRYDVDQWASEVGGAVSSSNGVVGIDGFVVESTEDIVMNVEVCGP